MKNITISNYREASKGWNFSQMPAAFKESHEITLEAAEDNGLAYNQVPEIKEMVDLYFQKLIEWNGQKQPAPEMKVSKPSKSSKKESSEKKVAPAKEKTNKVVKKAAPEPDYTEHYSHEVQVIKRFYAMHNRPRTFVAVSSFYKSLQRLITERKIRKASKYAALINMIQEKLHKLFTAMKDQELKSVNVQISDDLLKKVEPIATEVKILPSVALLKRFISLKGEKPSVKKASDLLKQIENAFKAGKIKKSDEFISQVNEVEKALQAYIASKTTSIEVSTATLSGIAGLGCPGTDGKDCGCSKPAPTLAGVKKKAQPAPKEKSVAKPAVATKMKLPVALQNIFTAIDKPGIDTKANTFRLKGGIGKLLGNLERKEFAIALRGEKGAGKTTFLYQLKNAFAEAGFNVASFTLEIDKQSDLVQRMTAKYIAPHNRSRIQAASVAPGGIATIREAAKFFDVVCIDSWSKLGVKQEEFDRLRKDFPNTLFIVIFQSTTNGTARGGSMAEYDAGIVLQVDLPGIAYCEKNRYADAESGGLKYDVFNSNLIKDLQ